MGTVIRWFARALGVIINLLALLIIVVTLNPIRDYPLQEIPALILLVLANLGVLLAWFNERKGGLLAVCSGLGCGVALYFSSLSIGVGRQLSLFLSLAYGLPYLLVGLLFFLLGRWGGSRSKYDEDLVGVR